MKQDVMPDGVDLKVRPAKRKKGAIQRFEIVYQETFFDLPKEVKDNTLRLATALMGHLKVTVLEKKRETRFVVKGVCSRQEIGNMMFGEFAMWSDLGTTTFKDLWLMLGVARAQLASPPPAIPARPPPPLPPSLRQLPGRDLRQSSSSPSRRKTT